MLNKIIRNILKDRKEQLDQIQFNEASRIQDATGAIPEVKEARMKMFDLCKSKDYTAKKFNELEKEYEKVLKKYSLTQLTSTLYICKKCNDSIIKDGKLCSCVTKDLFKQEALKLCFDNLNEFKKFKQLKLVTNNKLKPYFNTMKEIATNKGTHSIYILFGGPGVGKTTLALSLIDMATDNFKTCKFIKSFNLNNKFKDVCFNNEELDDNDDIYTAEILVIDDLGNEQVINTITNEYYIDLIEKRNQNDLVTVFTTNLSPSQISSHFNERLASRLYDTSVSKTLNKEFIDHYDGDTPKYIDLRIEE